jgi:hypothetical protein
MDKKVGIRKTEEHARFDPVHWSAAARTNAQSFGWSSSVQRPPNYAIVTVVRFNAEKAATSLSDVPRAPT